MSALENGSPTFDIKNYCSLWYSYKLYKPIKAFWRRFWSFCCPEHLRFHFYGISVTLVCVRCVCGSRRVTSTGTTAHKYFMSFQEAFSNHVSDNLRVINSIEDQQDLSVASTSDLLSKVLWENTFDWNIFVLHPVRLLHAQEPAIVLQDQQHDSCFTAHLRPSSKVGTATGSCTF